MMMQLAQLLLGRPRGLAVCTVRTAWRLAQRLGAPTSAEQLLALWVHVLRSLPPNAAQSVERMLLALSEVTQTAAAAAQQRRQALQLQVPQLQMGEHNEHDWDWAGMLRDPPAGAAAAGVTSTQSHAHATSPEGAAAASSSSRSRSSGTSCHGAAPVPHTPPPPAHDAPCPTPASAGCGDDGVGDTGSTPAAASSARHGSGFKEHGEPRARPENSPSSVSSTPFGYGDATSASGSRALGRTPDDEGLQHARDENAVLTEVLVDTMRKLQAAREDLARSFSQAAAAEDLSRLLLEERRANEDLVVLSHWVVVDGEGGAGGGGGGGGHHRVSRGGARRARSADARVSEGDERARAWTAVAAAGKEEEEEQQGGGCSYDRASPSAGRSGGRRGGHLSEGGAPTAADSLGPQHATASLGGAGSGDVDAQPLDAIDGSGLCVALSCGGAG